ncbi:unnamed protein product, partial [Didymodactylos carnosus]
MEKLALPIRSTIVSQVYGGSGTTDNLRVPTYRLRFIFYEEDAQHWQVSLTLVSDNPNELYDDDEHPYEYSSFEMPSIYKSLSVDKPADIKLLSAGLSLLFCNDNPSNERKLSNPHEMAEKYYNLFLNDNNNSVSYTGLAIVAHQRGKSLEEENKHFNFGELIDKILSSNKFIKQLAELIQKEFQLNDQTIITFADRLGQLENKQQQEVEKMSEANSVLEIKRLCDEQKAALELS